MPETHRVLRVNGEEKSFPAASSGFTVGDLLASLSLNPDSVVVERNGGILQGEGRDTTALQDGDSLELIHFVGGG